MTRAREYHLMRTYGITLEQYDSLLASQDGACALCLKTPEEEGQSLAVDHDHKSGEVRGLLCRYCNHRVIGRHRDGDLLRKMAEYVERKTGWFVPPKPKKKRKRNGRTKNPSTGHRDSSRDGVCLGAV